MGDTEQLHLPAAEGEQAGHRAPPEKSHCEIFFYAKPEVERPCCTCSSLCCALFVWILILVGSILGGVEILRFETDVPFYLHDSDVYKRQTYLFSAFDTANARLGGDLREREEAEETFRLRVIYERDGDTSLFSPEVLAEIKSLEEKIVANVEYADFCALNYGFNEDTPICIRQSSAVSFFDPDWWVPATNPPPQPNVPSAANTDVLFNGSTILGNVEESYYAFANPQDASAISRVDLSLENIETIASYWAGYCSDADNCPEDANGDSSPYAITYLGSNITIGNAILSNVDVSFGINGDQVNVEPQALLTVYYFGVPQLQNNGDVYKLGTEQLEEQRENLGAFLFDAYDGLLGTGLENAKVFWDGEQSGMLNVYVNNILFNDVLLLLPTFAFVLIYLIFQLQSWWLGGVGMLMILGNFGPALILYRVIAGYSYFGTLNALSIFVILGVGADDIFVFTDSWKHARRTMPNSPVIEQLLAALHSGGKAMAVTSLTTAISFLANATSEFPAVQSFGIFSAFLVISNFFSVVILFPAITMVYEYYMHDTKGPGPDRGCCLTTCHCCKNGEEVKKGKVNIFFEEKFYPFVRRFAKPLLLLYLVIMVFYVIIGSQLVPDSKAPSLLPESDQYFAIGEKLTKYFSRSETSNRVTAEIPFGIIGTDRGDCEGSPCDPTIPTDYGSPIWDENIAQIKDERAQKWMLDFCDAVEFGDDASTARMVYPADDSNPSPVRCIHSGLKNWCNEDVGRCNQTHPELSADEYIADKDSFDLTFFHFLNSEISITDPNYAPGLTNYDIWQRNIRGALNPGTEDVANATLKYISVEVLLTARADLEFSEGIALYNDWTDFLDEWLEKSEDIATYGESATAYSSAFVTDRGFFHYFFLQETIIAEAFRGIGLSLAAAFLILCVSTGNWIVSVMATITISSMVGGVVTFTVLNGWKLGVLEAVLFVMVVGFSVDYTIHLSDSYLESHHKTRGERCKDMLGTMGVSVLSGALSTIGACISLLFAYVIFFLKFGTVILFIIAQSLIFSLFFYSSMLVMFGPEERQYGVNIKKGSLVFVREAANPGVADKGGVEEHLREGCVTGVDGEDCTVLMLGIAREAVKVPIACCRLAHERGQITAVKLGRRFLANLTRKGKAIAP